MHGAIAECTDETRNIRLNRYIQYRRDLNGEAAFTANERLTGFNFNGR